MNLPSHAFTKVGSVLLVASGAFISWWLMSHTFSYYSATSQFGIARTVWSDFAAHVAVIRSFSLGKNWPPEYPLYFGEPIRYHFLFYFLVGILEKVGLRIDYALNIPSAIGFFLLLFLIYKIALTITKSRLLGVLSVLFFLCNGSLSVFRYLSQHDYSWHSLSLLPSIKEFLSFGPWDHQDIAIFWTLNIFTNQRHLSWGYAVALGLLLISLLLTERQSRETPWGYSLLMGSAVAILPYFHQPALFIVAILGAILFLILPRARVFILLVGVLSCLPVLYQVKVLLPKGDALGISLHPGYLMTSPPFPWESFPFPFNLDSVNVCLSYLSAFVSYWWHNIGAHIFLIPLGALFLGKKSLPLLIPSLVLFILGNVFQFSVEMAANHKLFNFAIILSGILSATVIGKLFTVMSRIRMPLLRIPAYALPLILLSSTVASGIVDLFPIINDEPFPFDDMPSGSAARWINASTNKEATFLNSSFTFHPASIAGRKIFQGWPYFTWSAGYKSRTPEMFAIYNARSPSVLCELLKEYHLDYMTVEPTEGDELLPKMDLDYYRNSYEPVYQSATMPFLIVSQENVCKKAVGDTTK